MYYYYYRIYILIFQLLLKPKFSCIEKIKTIGSTYMIASGLRPGKEGTEVMYEPYVLLHGAFYILLGGTLNE